MPSIIRGVDDFDSLESQGLGDGQTWQDVKASRAAGVTYTNSTGRPIYVTVSVSNSAGNTSRVDLLVDGNSVCRNLAQTSSGSSVTTAEAIVPNNSTYSFDIVFGLLSSVWELR